HRRAARVAHAPSARAERIGRDAVGGAAIGAVYVHRSGRPESRPDHARRQILTVWKPRSSITVPRPDALRTVRPALMWSPIVNRTLSAGAQGTAEADRSGNGQDARRGGALIQFDNVGLRYGLGAEVLRDVTFEIQPKSFQFLTGPSGAGKTTLLRLLFLSLK